MPELPEVETVRRIIEPQIKGLSIIDVIVNRPEVVAHPDADIFKKSLQNQIIKGIERRGKFLTIRLESGDRVSVHLRMTGCLLFAPPDFKPAKHTHIILQMSNEWNLHFTDTRRFGRFWYFTADEEDTVSGIKKLGIEPFDKNLNSQYLTNRLSHRKKPIKECLLDQTIIAGIGNIYADEILFASGIYPFRPANTLTDPEWERLADNIPKCLAYFIEKNSMTPEEYLAGKGKDYRNTPYLQVYGKAERPCPVCGELLHRCVIGGRGSVYCPVCQG